MDSDYRVQSIVFDKDQIGLQEAIDWVVSHKDKVKKIDETDTQYRFRQLDPAYLRRQGFTKYVTKRLNDVVSLILVYREDTGACWEGYEQFGMKMKNGRKVPNCVPQRS